MHGTALVLTASVAPPSSTRVPPSRSESVRPVDGPLPPDIDPDQPRPTKEAPLVGRLLHDRYRILGVIAKGGMGMVYDGIHIGLRRRVAIKTLRGQYAHSKTAIARFHNEAAVAGRFGHPNIVEVYDLGVLDDGTPYLVMERLEGETITERLARERPMPLPVALDVAVQVLSALIVTHAEGILHRDLKPDNICLVGGDRGPLTVKVLDFGVAEAFNTGNMPSVLVSTGAAGSHSVAGTPAFMAPEQAQGVRDLDARADLYSVGMLLYVMLTGQLPFKAPTPQALLAEIQRVKLIRPRMLRPDVPPSLDVATMRALALDREERFPSAASMLDALEQVQIEAAIGGNAPPEPPGEPTDPDSEKVEYFVRGSVLPPPMEK
ncbi:serine/threonine-protein kinase [Sorangium sp. So ce1036]|uniref:serine/threonine-protein kinase n=1 Tax=Sorangium sp. So ce1036 TaxID=3133328 RepID=UPI003EFCFCAD